MPRAYFSLVLHAHLPFVRHPEHASFFEERWLYEAITECYLPLLRMLDGLKRDKIPCRLALSISPTLATMLGDPLLQQRYRVHLKGLLTLSEKEVERTKADPGLHTLAVLYRKLYEKSQQEFETRWHGNLNAAFLEFSKAGLLELMTTAATHGYLPLLKNNPAAVRAQVVAGARAHEEIFGEPAQGLWLPECAYFQGLETVLQQSGFQWFIVDAHGLLKAAEQPKHGLFAPVKCPNGLAAFGRDAESARQVWSAAEGYPGDADYREYYRDIGFDLPEEHIGPWMLEGKKRAATGIKYHRITGRTEQKDLYDPLRARRKVEQHAAHFLAARISQAEQVSSSMDRPPLMLAPFDAELFGHWWFEGPLFLDSFFRQAAQVRSTLSFITPSDYLAHHGGGLQETLPSASSWGWQGYYGGWISAENDWIYPHLHQAAERMEALTRRWVGDKPSKLQTRVLNQALRELMLAQASDWPFMLHNKTSVAYANKRIKDGLARFAYLAGCAESDEVDPIKLRALEMMDNLFPVLDFRIFRR